MPLSVADCPALQKLSSLAEELGCTPMIALELLTAQPNLFNVNMPGMVRDKVEQLSDVLGVSVTKVGPKCSFSNFE